MTASAEVVSMGLHRFWGLSSPVDFAAAFLNSYTSSNNNDDGDGGDDNADGGGDGVVRGSSDPLCVLLLEASDVRHVLKTLAQRHRHQQLREIHIYMMDNPVEVVARNLLLLEVALDTRLPIRERANTFLEIFGNVKLQERTAEYVARLGHELSFIGDEKQRGIMKLQTLNHRHTDSLESCFRSYALDVQFEVDEMRDRRLRHYYGERYDFRSNLVDWDYQNSVRPVASIIHPRLFKDWRLNGIAFEFGDQTYTHPNKTMSSYTEGTMKAGKDRGIKKEVRGFWGDVSCSPYFAFGIDCETPNAFAEGLFEIHNKNTGAEQHRHHAVEVCVYNMLSYLYELEHREQYQMLREHDIYSGLGAEELQEGKAGEGSTESKQPLEQSTIALDGVQIHFLTGDIKKELSKAKYQHKFDTIFFGTGAVHHAGDAGFCSHLLREQAVVALETAKHMVPLRKESKAEFQTKLEEMASSQGWTPVQPVYRRRRDENDLMDDILFFRR